jgi:hypothetical protein
MNWTEAVEAMKTGKTVRRVSESVRRREGDAGGIPIFATGNEPCNLEPACTADGEQVLVFRGDWSRVLFAPSDADKAADDWIVVPSDQKHGPDARRL